MFLSSSRGENWWRNGVITRHPGPSSRLTVKDLCCGGWYHVQRQHGGVGGLRREAVEPDLSVTYAVTDRGQAG